MIFDTYASPLVENLNISVLNGFLLIDHDPGKDEQLWLRALKLLICFGVIVFLEGHLILIRKIFKDPKIK